MYDEVSTKHVRRNHDKTYTMKKFRQNMYDEEIMKIHEGRNEGRKEVRSNILT